MKSLRGLVFLDHHTLGYGYNHGFGRRWLPYWASRIIVCLWNPIACQFWGHSWFPDFEQATWLDERKPDFSSVTEDLCSDCSKRRPTLRKKI